VSASAHTLLLVNEDGRNTLFGTGTNTFGQLGRQCALRDDEDKQVFAKWRRLNLVGELETRLDEEEWEPIQIGATWTSSIVVYRRIHPGDSGVGEDMVVSCGSNDFNELGYTDTTPSGTAPVTTASPPRIVNLSLGSGDRIEHLGCGQRHVMVVVSDRQGVERVIGWGAGRRGEFDLSTLGGEGQSSSQGMGKGKGKGKAPARPTTYPPTTLNLPLDRDNGERIAQLKLGSSHTLIITSHGRVLAWGSNQKGQITSTGSLNDIKQISASWGGSYLHTSDGRLLSQGSNIYSQLLHQSDGRAAVEIPEGYELMEVVAGSEHVMCKLRRGTGEELWVGGWNEHGNLGLGDQKDRAQLTRVKLPGGKIKGIWGGCASTWVWIED
jgi:protein ATS1